MRAVIDGGDLPHIARVEDVENLIEELFTGEREDWQLDICGDLVFRRKESFGVVFDDLDGLVFHYSELVDAVAEFWGKIEQQQWCGILLGGFQGLHVNVSIEYPSGGKGKDSPLLVASLLQLWCLSVIAVAGWQFAPTARGIVVVCQMQCGS